MPNANVLNVVPGLAGKNLTSLKCQSKHSSLFFRSVSGEEERLMLASADLEIGHQAELPLPKSGSQGC